MKNFKPARIFFVKKFYIITTLVISFASFANSIPIGLQEEKTLTEKHLANLDGSREINKSFESEPQVEFAGQVQKLSQEEFTDLINYSEKYLINNINNLTVYKNISGFVRVSIPSPEHLSNIIKDIRLNYWLPNCSINPESIHSHPIYFESMVIRGGYTHELYKKGVEDNKKYNVYRVSKNKEDKRTSSFINKSYLKSIGQRLVDAGSTIQFPKSLIHRILSAKPHTLTINVVFKDNSEETFFDVYKLEDFQKEDLKIEKESLPDNEARIKIAEIISLLPHQNQDLTA